MQALHVVYFEPLVNSSTIPYLHFQYFPAPQALTFRTFQGWAWKIQDFPRLSRIRGNPCNTMHNLQQLEKDIIHRSNLNQLASIITYDTRTICVCLPSSRTKAQPEKNMPDWGWPARLQSQNSTWWGRDWKEHSKIPHWSLTRALTKKLAIENDSGISLAQIYVLATRLALTLCPQNECVHDLERLSLELWGWEPYRPCFCSWQTTTNK